MKALQVINNQLTLADVSRPSADGEAVVRVELSGICNTDLEIVRGYADFSGTIGPEFVGVVEEAVGQPLLVGKRVVGEINAGCGHCELCRAGDPRHCPDRTVLGIHDRDGSHSEYLRLPVENLIAVPDNVTNEAAVFTEPLGAALGISERIKVERGSRIAVIGDGKLGILGAWALASVNGTVTLIGKHAEKLKRAETNGVEIRKVPEITDLTRQFDIVVEASGSESGFGTALDLVRPRGTIVLKSTFHGRPTWDAARVVVDEISIVGSRCGRFQPALDLLASRQFDRERLIDDEFTLEDGVKAMERAAERGVLKVLLRP